MSIKEMTLLDVIELSNRMDAASRDVSACGALRPAGAVKNRHESPVAKSSDDVPIRSGADIQRCPRGVRDKTSVLR